ncbi:MAG: hypothetical protein KR126chlam3_01504 [Chlamydiae bacterium]|nr:hypothetical protein [Chlamydiota bacterium]
MSLGFSRRVQDYLWKCRLAMVAKYPTHIQFVRFIAEENNSLNPSFFSLGKKVLKWLCAKYKQPKDTKDDRKIDPVIAMLSIFFLLSSSEPKK